MHFAAYDISAWRLTPAERLGFAADCTWLSERHLPDRLYAVGLATSGTHSWTRWYVADTYLVSEWQYDITSGAFVGGSSRRHGYGHQLFTRTRGTLSRGEPYVYDP